MNHDRQEDTGDQAQAAPTPLPQWVEPGLSTRASHCWGRRSRHRQSRPPLMRMIRTQSASPHLPGQPHAGLSRCPASESQTPAHRSIRGREGLPATSFILQTQLQQAHGNVQDQRHQYRSVAQFHKGARRA